MSTPPEHLRRIHLERRIPAVEEDSAHLGHEVHAIRADTPVAIASSTGEDGGVDSTTATRTDHELLELLVVTQEKHDRRVGALIHLQSSAMARGFAAPRRDVEKIVAGLERAS